ncbi:MAG: arginine--tRNA ligase [Prevotellaceae bacterium]|nr:arginine--tRNA ligase [Prevotellaceae bacterium]
MIEQILINAVQKSAKELYSADLLANQIQLQKTKREFEGDITLVVFPLLKISKQTPEKTAEQIGEYLSAQLEEITGFNVVKGFLNLCINEKFWLNQLAEINKNPQWGRVEAAENAETVMIEYSSPNTNKPLHLGHIRNNLLGFSLGEILKANGKKVIKTNIVNDRGIHICKSMLAWQKWGNGETPESSGIKGDHLVGKYYVIFDKEYKAQINQLAAQGQSEDEAKKNAPLILEAQEMLRKWEEGDLKTRQLWEMMNSWVYAGFAETYKALGVDFDKIYYESDTYLVGKEEVERGLAESKFYRRADGSVWVDLTADGLDEKLLLRADGTSVYMTQDIGTAKLRYTDYKIDKMVYVVGNEQDYHFKVLSLVLDKLGFAWGKSLVHFSYGMVELPEGKMKSREGTVVDADDLIASMIETARETALSLGKLDADNEEEINNIAYIVALGALKYFILKVDPHKNMLFNPKESIDFNGNTGPFIQYTYARIQSVLRKATSVSADLQSVPTLEEVELSLIRLLCDFPVVIRQAGEEYSPSVIANYTYELAKEYNRFYHDCSILREEHEKVRNFRLILSANVARVICTAMSLLGINVPETM